MARFVYQLTNGRASDLRFARDDYVLLPGELEGQTSDTLPTIDSLSSVSDPVVATEQASAARVAQFLADTDRQTLLANFLTATPAQIKTYVNNNVTDLASAKVLLQRILLLVAVIIRN